MTAESILKLYNVSVDSTKESIFDLYFKEYPCYQLSLFPNTIINNNKYEMVSVFYQRVKDKTMKSKEFQSHEKKYHNFITTLWLYGDCYFQVLDSLKQIKGLNFIQKHWLKKNNMYCIKEKDIMLCEDYKLLKILLSLGTKEFTQIVFFFPNLGIILYLDGCNGLISFISNDFFPMINTIVTTNQLYLYPDKVGTPIYNE